MLDVVHSTLNLLYKMATLQNSELSYSRNSVLCLNMCFGCLGASDDEITVEETSFVHTEPPQDGTAPPVVTSDMEVLNDKVKKQVIKEGHGKKPSRFATCFGKYAISSQFVPFA